MNDWYTRIEVGNNSSEGNGGTDLNVNFFLGIISEQALKKFQLLRS